MKKIIPFVDHEIGYRLLEKLITFSFVSNDYEVSCVVTTAQNDTSWWPGVKKLCHKYKIPLYIYEKKISLDIFKKKPDWILLLSWKHIVNNDLINLPSIGILNLHYSLLPKHKGSYPVNWALINGDRTTGFTYHFVNNEIDGGEIFMQKKVSIQPQFTARSLQLQIDDEVIKNFDFFIHKLLNYSNKISFKTVRLKQKLDKKINTKKAFENLCFLDLKKNYQGQKFINLLKGLSFKSDSKNAYFIDSRSGKKIYINITLSE